MRRVSDKRKQLLEEIEEAENEFKFEHHQCWVRGCRRTDLHLHHMVRGSSRQLALKHRECWMRLCSRHHEELHRENWPLALQLAVKVLNDPAYYDRRLVLELRGEAESFVTPRDVASELFDLRRLVPGGRDASAMDDPEGSRGCGTD